MCLRDTAYALHLRHPFGILQSFLRLQFLSILEASSEQLSKVYHSKSPVSTLFIVNFLAAQSGCFFICAHLRGYLFAVGKSFFTSTTP